MAPMKSRFFSLILSLIALVWASAPVVGAPSLLRNRLIRVGLVSLGTPASARVIPSGKHIEAFDPTAQTSIFTGPAEEVTLTCGGKGIRLVLNGKTVGSARELILSPVGRPPNHLTVSLSSKAKRSYRGSLHAIPQGKGMRLVNAVDIEKYLQSVVPCEIWNRAADETLKAQAIAARTYAARNLNRHLKSGFHLCDKVHCQVYKGIVKEVPAASRAVQSTAGMVLYYDGSPVNAVYHSNCGGQLLDSRKAWGGKKVPYLLAHYDGLPGKPTFCSLGRALRAKSNRGQPRVRPNKIKIKVLPWKSSRSYHSHRGHRVGMCQDGAIGMGHWGYSARTILAFYYPRTTLVRLPYAQEQPRIARLPKHLHAPSTPPVLASAGKKPPADVERPPPSSPAKQSQPVRIAAGPKRFKHPGFRKWFWGSLTPHLFSHAPPSLQLTLKPERRKPTKAS